jgi:hypothetical protein
VSEILETLQNWYSANCDGDWEHEFAIRITNIDNPGWSVSIPLAGTPLERRPFAEIQWQHGLDDWVLCRVKDDTFLGQGGSRNLAEILRVFVEWMR